MTMGNIACPHCGASNVSESQFCASCGKALPSAIPTGPRVVAGADLAATPGGMKLQSAELEKQAKKSANALAVVAGLTTLGAIIFTLLLANAPGGREMPITWLDVGINIAVAVIFWALYVWARKNPLPPAIVG